MADTSTFALPRPQAARIGFWGYLALYRQRRQLAQLNDEALLDLGLTRQEALAEANRPLWDAPVHWTR